MNLRTLRYFVAVVDAGSLTAASLAIPIAQPALTRHIKQLEAELDQRLFHRTGRTLTLTEAGQVALAYADSIIATGNELVEVLRSLMARWSLRDG